MSVEPNPIIRMPAELPKPPEKLQAGGRRVWDSVVVPFELATFELEMLGAACQSLDVAAKHKRKLDREGLAYKDKAGNPRPHPSCAEYRNSLDTYRKLLRELSLDVEPPASRPPGSPRGYR